MDGLRDEYPDRPKARHPAASRTARSSCYRTARSMVEDHAGRHSERQSIQPQGTDGPCGSRSASVNVSPCPLLRRSHPGVPHAHLRMSRYPTGADQCVVPVERLTGALSDRPPGYSAADPPWSVSRPDEDGYLSSSAATRGHTSSTGSLTQLAGLAGPHGRRFDTASIKRSAWPRIWTCERTQTLRCGGTGLDGRDDIRWYLT